MWLSMAGFSTGVLTCTFVRYFPREGHSKRFFVSLLGVRVCVPPSGLKALWAEHCLGGASPLRTCAIRGFFCVRKDSAVEGQSCRTESCDMDCCLHDLNCCVRSQQVVQIRVDIAHGRCMFGTCSLALSCVRFHLCWVCEEKKKSKHEARNLKHPEE